MSRDSRAAKDRRNERARQERDAAERAAAVERQARELAHLEHMRDHNGELYRAELIERTANASRRACPPILPTTSAPGFAFAHPDSGGTCGKRYDTEAAAAASWTASEDGNIRAFAAQLRNMSDGELAAQAGYWIKDAP